MVGPCLEELVVFILFSMSLGPHVMYIIIFLRFILVNLSSKKVLSRLVSLKSLLCVCVWGGVVIVPLVISVCKTFKRIGESCNKSDAYPKILDYFFVCFLNLLARKTLLEYYNRALEQYLRLIFFLIVDLCVFCCPWKSNNIHV